MFKSAVPSVAPSASASASSHDTHSLPPAFKGPVQRFLAVSLPTVTLTPELIDVLDAVDIILPSRIQVTIRWWNEDTASSLSIYPKLNSPLAPSIEAHQAHLRQIQLDSERALQEQQQQQQQLQHPNEIPISSADDNEALPSSSAQTPPRSKAAKFLRRPWTSEKTRILNVFRIGKNKKSKDTKATASTSMDVSISLDTHNHNDNTAPDLSSSNDNKQQQQEQDAPSASIVGHTPLLSADTKPLPTLPDAAFPITVAYPVRCSLDQLYRYFVEMTSLALEIQVSPNLTLLASVPNLADLFRNIHGTFSGVFPFTTVLQNDHPQLINHKIFNRKTVLGMVVFQAWCQDTSDISDTSEESETGSNVSIRHDYNNGIPFKQPQSIHPLSPNTAGDPSTFQQPQSKVENSSYHGQYHQNNGTNGRQPPVVPRPHGALGHPPSLRFDDEPAIRRHRRSPSSIPSSAGPSRASYEGRQEPDTVGMANVRRSDPSRHFPNIKLPVLDQEPYHSTRYLRSTRNSIRRQSQDESLYRHRHRRSDDANAVHRGHASRSRPRSGATAAAIGRLDSVLARGEDLLQGIKTSLALDPEEVRTRSAKHIRSSIMIDDQDDNRFRPYHESLPYWPSKSRFRLELSIPTAYLTSYGLLKGSKLKQRQPERPRPQQSQARATAAPASGLVVMTEKSTRSPHHMRHHAQEFQGGHQEYWESTVSDRGREGPLATSVSESPTRGTRRTGKPVLLEKMARKSDMARLRLAQEESAAHPHYQSFQTSSSHRRQEEEEEEEERILQEEQRRKKEGSPMNHPRKSRSYPLGATATTSESRQSWRQHRRRLSSNDRLQIRMNPRPSDLLNNMPDLFPSKSMSGLVRPEYQSSATGSSISDSYSTGHSYSLSTGSEDHRQSGGIMGGRQSRLQRRRRIPSVEEEDEEMVRLDRQRRHKERSQDRRKESRQKRKKNKGLGQDSRRRKSQGGQSVHVQHFDFKANCQLLLTPEVMAACMLENISVEIWKLNPKRQTMIELGSAKLPLHKVLSRILQKTASETPYSSDNRMHGAEGLHDTYFRGGAAAAGSRAWQQQQYHRGREERTGSRRMGSFKDGWRLEPSLYDIRSRQGTVIGQLDAEVWILPRSRSDSMVSAAA
ncbi:hypothetical protein FBU30_006636 [Linnemannia zychae]|nr:hypothetical protein FBU30_006636 [Linnemannia zychae]